MRVQTVVLLVCVLFHLVAHADPTSELFAALEDNQHAEAASALSRGANARAKNATGETPLHVVARMGQGMIIEALLRAGADVDARNELGQTPLHVASAYGHEQEVRMLLGFGADLSLRDREGLRAQELAMLNEETEVATLLGTPEMVDPLRGPRLELPSQRSFLSPGILVPMVAFVVFAASTIKGNH